jgi:hypothetical protein
MNTLYTKRIDSNSLIYIVRVDTMLIPLQVKKNAHIPGTRLYATVKETTIGNECTLFVPQQELKSYSWQDIIKFLLHTL